jgi:hypothetical protein
MKWRNWHGLCGCCDYGQSKGNSDQPDHLFSPIRHRIDRLLMDVGTDATPGVAWGERAPLACHFFNHT